MKKFIQLLLLLLCIVSIALAAPSRTNKDIASVEIIDVEPENEDEPVIVPHVKIVDDTEEIIWLREDMRPRPTITLFEYEVPLGLGFFSVSNLGFTFE